MKKKMRIFLVIILSFAMSISMGISAYADGLDFATTTGGAVEIEETPLEPVEDPVEAGEPIEATAEEAVEPAEGEKEVDLEVPVEPTEPEQEPRPSETEEVESTEEAEDPQATEAPQATEEAEATQDLGVAEETQVSGEVEAAEPKELEESAEGIQAEAPVVEEIATQQVQAPLEVSLEAEVNLINESYANGDTIKYEIILNNNGDVDINDLSLVDSLGLDKDIKNLSASETKTIKGKFEIDRFNTLEEIGNEIDIIGQVEGERIHLSLAFKVAIEIPKGSLTIKNVVAGEVEKDQEFDIFVEGPRDSLYVLSLKKGQSEVLDNLWLGDYTISSAQPMNYEVGKDNISVELTKNKPDKSRSIKHTRTNDRWFYDDDTELVVGKTIRATEVLLQVNNYTFDGEENILDAISYEIPGVEEAPLEQEPDKAQATPIDQDAELPIEELPEQEVPEPAEEQEPVIEEDKEQNNIEEAEQAETTEEEKMEQAEQAEEPKTEQPLETQEQKEPQQSKESEQGETEQVEQSEATIPEEAQEEASDSEDKEEMEKSKEPDKATGPEEILGPKETEEQPPLASE